MYQLSLTAQQLESKLEKVRKLNASMNITDATYNEISKCIRVDTGHELEDGDEIKFRSPVPYSYIIGLEVCYQDPNTGASIKTFMIADADGNNDVGELDYLFGEGAVVKVILDVTNEKAFVQNADTNRYLEDRFSDMQEQLGAKIQLITWGDDD